MKPSEEAACDILEWDSDFFRSKIARLREDTLRPALADAVDVWCERQAVDCLYALLRSDDPESSRVALSHGYRLVDVRVTLERETSCRPESQLDSRSSRPTCVIRPFQARDLPGLRRIARARHRDTRFFFDGNFAPQRCEDLYERWIIASCEGYAQAVFVAQPKETSEEGMAQSSDCIGYITCHLDEPEKPGRIGLVAVDAASTSRGVGRALVESAVEWFAPQGRLRVSVVTQGRNVPAIRLYERCGFSTSRVELYYHKWYPREALR